MSTNKTAQTSRLLAMPFTLTTDNSSMLQQIRNNLDMRFNSIIDTSWGSTPPPPADPSHGGGDDGGNHDQTWRIAVLVLTTVSAGVAVLNTTLILAIGGLIVAPILGRLLH